MTIQTSQESFAICLTPEILAALRSGAVVAVGVSGGKDSSAVARRVKDYLDEIGHAGPRLLIHSDLGRIEWRESLRICERLAAGMGWDLLTVRRGAGDMLDRWEGRWKNNVARYAELACMKLILPWSTPSMRFCTSELKTDIICAALKKRFPERPIISVTGVRRDESSARAKMPISQVQQKLCRRGIEGWNWNAIIDWPTADVYAYLEAKNEPLHEAYTRYGCSRVSCCFCIMSAIDDMSAAIRCEDNHPVYRQLVELEIASSFAFQGNRWLGDLAPDLLTSKQRDGIARAKDVSRIRVAAENRLPKHLLYEKGWPRFLPSRHDATLVAEIRRQVAEALNLEIRYTDPESIIDRFAELLEEGKRKGNGAQGIGFQMDGDQYVLPLAV